MSKEHTEKNAAVEGFKNKQLTYKISVAVGILLVACLTVVSFRIYYNNANK